MPYLQWMVFLQAFLHFAWRGRIGRSCPIVIKFTPETLILWYTQRNKNKSLPAVLLTSCAYNEKSQNLYPKSISYNAKIYLFYIYLNKIFLTEIHAYLIFLPFEQFLWITNSWEVLGHLLKSDGLSATISHKCVLFWRTLKTFESVEM